MGIPRSSILSEIKKISVLFVNFYVHLLDYRQYTRAHTYSHKCYDDKSLRVLYLY